MAKSAITKKKSLYASGIVGLNGNDLVIENPDNGELINVKELFRDFLEHSVNISINCEENY